MHASSRVADFLSRLVVICLVVAGVVAVFVWYLPLIQENQKLRRELALQQSRIEALQTENNQMMRRLELFDGNPNTVERLIRENLGFGLPGETIVRFEEPRPPANPTPGR
ncbi:MAG TPA: septum formation initiator family protein [Verrucomicrobiae bacterium]|nr:septum formation initiator family protein [Verrucomicrobiae bacterium]